MEALRQYRLRCPEDVALVTCDDYPWMDSFSPRLTTIDLPKRELGAAAAQLLVERIAKQRRPRRARVRLKNAMRVRESCGCALRGTRRWRDDRRDARHAYDVLAMGRSSIDLYAHEIGVPIAEVTQLRRLRRRLPDQRQRRHAPARPALGAADRGRRRSGRRLRHRVSRARAGRDAVHPAQAGPPHQRRHPDDPAARQVSADLLSRQLRRSRAHDRRRGARAGRATAASCSSPAPASATSRRAPRRSPPPPPRARAGVPVVVDIDYRADQWDERRRVRRRRCRRCCGSATLAVGTEEELAAASGPPTSPPAPRRCSTAASRRWCSSAARAARRSSARTRRRPTSRRFRSRC